MTEKCGVVLGLTKKRSSYSDSQCRESSTHRAADVRSCTVFVGVPHQLCAYTVTTDKSVPGKFYVHILASVRVVECMTVPCIDTG